MSKSEISIMDENLEAVYSAIYRPCNACWGSIYDHDDAATVASVKSRLQEKPPLPTEIVGFVTKGTGIDCDYCLRVMSGG